MKNHIWKPKYLYWIFHSSFEDHLDFHQKENNNTTRRTGDMLTGYQGQMTDRKKGRSLIRDFQRRFSIPKLWSSQASLVFFILLLNDLLQQTDLAMVSMSGSLPHSVMLLGSGTFGRWLELEEGGVLLSGVSALGGGHPLHTVLAILHSWDSLWSPPFVSFEKSKTDLSMELPSAVRGPFSFKEFWLCQALPVPVSPSSRG